MAFTMHSHSGEFCPGHAKDDLEAVVRHALARGYADMALTEHMPRTALADLYPEELEPDPAASLAVLGPRHEAFVAAAARLRAAYAPLGLRLLVGFEAEWLRPDEYAPLVRSLAAAPPVDFFVGSLHHVDGVPIDFDADHYARALDAVRARPGPSRSEAEEEGQLEQQQQDEEEVEGEEKEEGAKEPEERLFERYYDQQHEMLSALRPRVVGHFDLIRLLSSHPDRDYAARWPGAWRRARRNLRLAAAHGLLLECNSSALRKGLAEPYPARPVAEEWLRLGGRFTLSDDSHGVAQVGTNYARALDYLAGLGVASVWRLQRRQGADDAEVDADKSPARLVEVEVPLQTIRDVVDKW